MIGKKKNKRSYGKLPSNKKSAILSFSGRAQERVLIDSFDLKKRFQSVSTKNGCSSKSTSSTSSTGSFVLPSTKLCTATSTEKISSSSTTDFYADGSTTLKEGRSFPTSSACFVRGFKTSFHHRSCASTKFLFAQPLTIISKKKYTTMKIAAVLALVIS